MGAISSSPTRRVTEPAATGAPLLAGTPTALAARALLAAASLPPLLSWVLVLVLLAGQWLLNQAAGGAGTIVPHGYYLPVLFVAGRFGHLAALAVAAVAGLLAGPLTYQEIVSATHQAPIEWVSRTLYFLAIGQLVAWLSQHARPSLQRTAGLAAAERELVRALEGDQLTVHYQPLVDLNSEEVRGFEALVRWDHPDGLRLPGAFLPVAEATGRMRQIGDVVLARACADAERWRRAAVAAGRRPPVVSVNLSVEAVGADDLVPRIERALRRSGLPPHLLCVEMTESAIIADIDGSIGRLQQLRDRGVIVAIDDFGAGQASLSYLHRLPADVLKLDRSFLAELPSGGVAHRIIAAILDLAGEMRLPVVAEGIETEDQQALLVGLGCRFGQGFHLGRPGPDGVVADWVERLPASSSDRTGADRPRPRGGRR